MSKLYNILNSIEGVKEDIKVQAEKRLDSLVKPLGSLGKLEKISAQIAGITGEIYNKNLKKCTIVMSADNGIVEEGVTSSPQSITAIQTINMLKGITGISVLSKQANADIKVIDIGINADIQHPLLVQRKIKYGTNNFIKGYAMSREEVEAAIEVGLDIVKELVDEGYQLLGTGEMGIGNTSSSSAVLMALTGCDCDVAVGKGGGLTDEALDNKKKIISKAIQDHKPDSNEPIDVLSKVGGLDIAGLVGCYIGAAYYRVPIVIDGFISSVAALIAYKLNPIIKEYMVPSHYSLEPGYKTVIELLGLEPILHMDMRLGEGTGCPLVFNIIEASLSIINNMATFEEASIDSEFLVDIRKS